MDSGNSGSMQSSSGGDEEYDSRAESISALLNHHPSSHLGPMTNPPPHHHHHHHHHQTHHSSSMLDPLSNIFNPISSNPNPNPLLNLDMVWSKTLRSDPNSADLSGLNHSQPFLTNPSQLPQQSRGGAATAAASSFASIQIPQENITTSAPNDQTNNNHNNNNNNNVGGGRNPKKRSRASRRAPTTVLTTDTTNFRAMVQEFTGIPAPPFPSSPFPRSRLDLFGHSSPSTALRSSSGPLNLDPSPPPPYLLRPFAHKLPLVDHSSTNLASNSSSINYSDIGGLMKQPNNQNQNQNLLNMNMQNSVLNFQSLFQTQQPNKYQLPNSSQPNILGSKPQGSSSSSLDAHQPNDPLLKMGSTSVLIDQDQFGLTHHGLNVLPNILSSSSDGRRDHNPAPTTTINWDNKNDTNNVEDHQGLLRSVNGNYSNLDRPVTNGNKGQENVTARSEGMVESWICSSD